MTQDLNSDQELRWANQMRGRELRDDDGFHKQFAEPRIIDISEFMKVNRVKVERFQPNPLTLEYIKLLWS